MWTLLVVACGHTARSTDVELSGPTSAEKHYLGQPPLGEPPALSAKTPHADYLQDVASSIQPPWRSFLEDCRLRLPPTHELNSQGLQVVVEIVARPNGSIVAVNTIKPSGNQDFDAVAVEIANDLRQLPKASPELLSDDEHVHLRWSFSRNHLQAGPASAEVMRLELPIEEVVPRLLAASQYASAAHRLLKDAGNGELALPLVTLLATKIVGDAILTPDPERSVLALHTVAAATLSEFAEKAQRALRSSDVNVATAAAQALAKVGQDSDRELLRALASGQEGAAPALSAAAATALVELGEKTTLVTVTSSNLTSETPKTRLAAMAVLSMLTSSESVPVLSGILGNVKNSRAERVAAAAALGQQAGSELAALKSLLTTTSSDDASIRVACVVAIGHAAKAGLRNRMAYWRMIELLRDKDERVRAGAIFAASLLDGARFAGELKGIRAGGSQQVLLSFARSLEYVPGPVAVARLVDLSAVEHLGMRQAATTSLLAHDEAQARARIQELASDEAEDVRLAAMPSLGTGPKLRALLGDSSPKVSGAALQTLAVAHGRGATAKELVTKLAGSGESREMQLRWAAAWLHGK